MKIYSMTIPGLLGLEKRLCMAFMGLVVTDDENQDLIWRPTVDLESNL